MNLGTSMKVEVGAEKEHIHYVGTLDHMVQHIYYKKTRPMIFDKDFLMLWLWGH